MGLGLEVGVEAVGLSGFVCCGSAGFVWVGVWLDLFGLGLVRVWLDLFGLGFGWGLL